jgi:N-acetylmuramic acid 6-phosphate (MurNAc-6-P) etherase
MITANQVAASPSFQAIAVIQALQLLAEKSAHTYENLFEQFKAGNEKLQRRVAEMVALAAEVTAEELNNH